jgi:hypothetical protein
MENTTLREPNAEIINTNLGSHFVITWLQQANVCQYVICVTSTTELLIIYSFKEETRLKIEKNSQIYVCVYILVYSEPE